MQVIFGIVAVVGYLFGGLVFESAPTAIQQGLAILILTNANLFLLAALWPMRKPKLCGSGMIAGTPFTAFDDGTVVLKPSKSAPTRFPTFDLMERCLKEQSDNEGPPPVMFEGWGRR